MVPQTLPILTVTLTCFSFVFAFEAGPPARTPVQVEPAKPATARTLQRFVGSWSLDLHADETTFGERGGSGSGVMQCGWGPLRAWVDCQMDSSYEGLGRYVLKVVLYPSRRSRPFGAFVTNSFGGGRLYLGRLRGPDRLVFDDAFTEPGRKWDHQRTTYTFHDDDTLSFAVEVSADGSSYMPHSSGTYRRR